MLSVSCHLPSDGRSWKLQSSNFSTRRISIHCHMHLNVFFAPATSSSYIFLDVPSSWSINFNHHMCASSYPLSILLVRWIYQPFLQSCIHVFSCRYPPCSSLVASCKQFHQSVPTRHLKEVCGQECLQASHAAVDPAPAYMRRSCFCGAASSCKGQRIGSSHRGHASWRQSQGSSCQRSRHSSSHSLSSEPSDPSSFATKVVTEDTSLRTGQLTHWMNISKDNNRTWDGSAIHRTSDVSSTTLRTTRACEPSRVKNGRPGGQEVPSKSARIFPIVDATEANISLPFSDGAGKTASTLNSESRAPTKRGRP